MNTFLRSGTRLLKPAKQAGQLRRFNLHEYQSKILMDKYGVRTQNGKEASDAAAARAVAEGIKAENPNCELILKAQVHAGGRGKGHFKETGMKGGVKVLSEVDEVEAPRVRPVAPSEGDRPAVAADVRLVGDLCWREY